MPATKRKRKRNVEEYQTFCIEIDDWSLSYGLHIGDRMRPDLPYSEHIALEINGHLLIPKRYSGRKIEITLLADREKAETWRGKELGYEPKCIGGLTLRGDRTEYLGSVPYDSVSILITSLDSGRSKFIQLHAKKLRYGQAETTSMHWFRDLDPDDYE